MKKTVKSGVLALACLCGSALAQEAIPLPEKRALDPSLVGNWAGQVPEQDSCAGYAWRTERLADGQYFLRYFNDNQTLLDDSGVWWVDENQRYYEYSSKTKDEPEVYTYQAQGAQARFLNVNDSDADACVPKDFIEQKVGI